MKDNPNAWIFGGIAVALLGIVLTPSTDCESFSISGLLLPKGGWGAGTILNSGLETRWALAAGIIGICWGFYRKASES